ncbi:MAG: hypothetical protein E6J45_10675, partial [Chloroflexi bacterium]
MVGVGVVTGSAPGVVGARVGHSDGVSVGDGVGVGKGVGLGVGVGHDDCGTKDASWVAQSGSEPRTGV